MRISSNRPFHTRIGSVWYDTSSQKPSYDRTLTRTNMNKAPHDRPPAQASQQEYTIREAGIGIIQDTPPPPRMRSTERERKKKMAWVPTNKTDTCSRKIRRQASGAVEQEDVVIWHGFLAGIATSGGYVHRRQAFRLYPRYLIR